jgi:tetratricopeptide (TPR) repeat protein
MSEKSYKKSIEQGVEFLKKTISVDSPKKKAALAKKSVENFKKAISIAQQLRLKKTPYIYEYLQQIQATLAASLLELKKIPEAIRTFEEALEANSKSPQNTKQKEIRAFIFAELAKLYLSLQKINEAEKYANQSLHLGSSEKNFNQEDLLDLFIELNPIFIRGAELGKITKNYRLMVKLAKRDKRKQIKAQVYFAYGKYMFGLGNDIAESKKYLAKAQSLFQSLGLHEDFSEVSKFIEARTEKSEKFKPDDDVLNSN